MRFVFGLGIVLSIVLYASALGTLRDDTTPGVTRITWATDANPARERQIAAFAEKFPGYEVVIEPVGGDLTKVIVRCATNVGPDVFDTFNAEQQAMVLETGIAMDLTAVADERGFGEDAMWPSVRDAIVVDGRQFAYSSVVSSDVVLYNRELFAELGIAEPRTGWTWDDMEDVGRLIRERSDDKIIPLGEMDLRTLLVSYGADYFDETGLFAGFDSPQALAATERLLSMMRDSRTIPDLAEASSTSAPGGWGSNAIAWFATERSAMLIIGRWFLVQLASYPELQGKLGAVLLPRAEGRESQGIVYTRAAVINAASDNADAATKFLQYLASAEYAAIIRDDNDALPPNPSFVQTGADLVNETAPDVEMQQTFLDAMDRARAFRLSRFVDLGMVERWLQGAGQRIRVRGVDPAVALKDLNDEVEREIDQNLGFRPDLRERFERETGRRWTSDWRDRIERPEISAKS